MRAGEQRPVRRGGNAPVMSNARKRSSTCMVSVAVSLRDVARNHADRAELPERPGGREHDPVGNAQRIAGKVICQNVAQADAPRVAAACSCSVPISCSAPAPLRAPRTAATRTAWPARCPGMAKMTSIWCSASQPPPPTVLAVDQHQRQPRPPARLSNGSAAAAFSSTFPGELMTHQQDRAQHPERGVERDGDCNAQQREPQRVQRRAAGRLPARGRGRGRTCAEDDPTGSSSNTAR